MTGLRAVVTNDDGIGSDGLAVLAAEAVRAGFEVTVAAPVRESSGTSAGLTAAERNGGGVLVQPRTLPGLPTTAAHAVAAHPAFIALAAAQGAFGPAPDVLLAGVNHGANLGRAVLHSGTVGAALTGSLHGARALAASVAVGLEPDDPLRWETVRTVLRAVLPLLADLPAGRTLNVNVPAVGPEELGELVRCPLARGGTVQARIEQLGDGRLRRVAAPLPAEPEPGTDAALLAAGYPTLSEIQPVQDAEHGVLPERLPALRRS